MKRTALEGAINRLTRLLDGNVSSEAKYQEFFQTNPVVFETLGYLRGIPKPRFPRPNRKRLEPDFLVQRPDGLFEIFELKTPQEKLIHYKPSREKFTANIDGYISQVETYSEYFDSDENRRLVNDRLSLNIQKRPDMVIVAGRDKGTDKALLHLLVRRRTGALQIRTYDDILSWLKFQHAALFGHTENLTGASWHGIVTLYKVDVQRPQYIFDVGDSLLQNRWSVYIDVNGYLRFELLDRNGASHSVAIRSGSHSFEYGVQIYLCCEFGSSDNSAIIQMLVNNSIVAQNELTFPINISGALDFNRKVIGANIEGKDHGTFNMAGLAIYKNTLTFQQRSAITEAIFDQFFTPHIPETQTTMTSEPKTILPNNSAYLVIGDLGKLERIPI